MADESPLRQSWNLYRQGRFNAALETLEPRIFQFREDPTFFRILGLCCLRLGDWKGGETYLQRSRQLEGGDHRDTLLGLVAVAARRRDHTEAVKLVLDLLDRDPTDKTAKKCLARLRQALAAPEGGPGLDSETLGQWLPPFHRPRPALKRWFLRLTVAVVLACGLAFGTWWGLALVRPSAPVKERPGPTPSPLPPGALEPGPAPGTFSITLTSEEVREGWSRAQKAFQDYQDSRARYEINRLLLSNASAGVKERARSLIPYLHEPDFSRPEDSSPFPAVKAAPALYEGCTVRWKGVISHLIPGEQKITFDLLYGYEDGQVVEGIVPVELGFAALLKNSQIVEVLGRIVLRDGQWFLQGTSLRDLGYRTP